MGTKVLKGWNPKQWVCLVPDGPGRQQPSAYREILETAWENRDSLRYAWRILSDGCCDGCAMGTRGLRDWTMSDVHLCSVRLRLLRLNTMPAMDWRLLEDVEALVRRREQSLRKLGRLAVPMVRRTGDKGFRRVSWDQAIALIAEKLRRIDPRGLAWYLASSGLTNEAYYAHQKVARFIGTNHVDISGRIGGAPGASALKAAVGCVAATCSYRDWIGSDLVVFVGTNVVHSQPVATKYLEYARKAGTKIFMVNPYPEPGMERDGVPSAGESAQLGTGFADDFFQVLPGGDIPFFYGVLKHLIANDRVDRDFIVERTRGWRALENKTKKLRWDVLERGSGMKQSDMVRFAEAFGRARSAIFVWGTGITHQRCGSDSVRAIVNLQLARGNVGRPHTGLMPIRGASGVQGGAEMGAMPSAYVMGFPVNRENAQRFAAEEMWGFRPPEWKGMGAAEMILGAERGEIDALWQSGGNFTDTLPEPDRVRQALARLKLRVHQDIVVNPAMLVDPGETVVLLPARNRYEQRGGGTETSNERRVIYSPEIPGPRPGEARDEWEIPVLLARHLDPEGAAKAFQWKDAGDIRAEIDRVCPIYRGIGKLRGKGESFQYGGPHLLANGFATPDGMGHFCAVELPREQIPKGKFLMITRRGKQFSSGVQSDADPLAVAFRDDVMMAAEDAKRFGLHEGDPIFLRNQYGRLRGRIKIDRIKPGNLQIHWPEGSGLFPSGMLDESGVPDYTAVVEVSRT